MPNAGAWVFERALSIPLAPGAALRSPGLVVFECTPLYGVDGEIEQVRFVSNWKKGSDVTAICVGNAKY
jgi:hypothetical protein